ncbi:MAG: YidC/Oxa1 family membrane protein insertase [Patescibacteria group bacterium]
MFNALFYQPLYNALVYLSSIVPGNNIGLAIILLTLLVKIVLLPLYHKAATTQAKMRKIEPEINRLKDLHKDNKEELAKKTLELYRLHQVNPFLSIVIIFIQLPILIALFYVFQNNFVFEPKLLYSFVTVPPHLVTTLWGISMTAKSIVLAVLTGLTQFVQMQIALPKLAKPETGKADSFKDDFARSMNLNMKYFMPVLIAFFAYNLSSAIGLYWVTSNIFSIGQEIYVRLKIKK